MNKLFAFALLSCFAMTAQDNGKACDVFAKVNTVLQRNHYKPKTVNDSLSAFVFETVMETLDDNRTVFLQEDYDRLALHKYKIDDYLAAKDCSFFGDFITTYKKALDRNKQFIEEITAENTPFETADTIFYSRKAYPYHKDPARIKKYLRKKLVYDILEDVAKLGTNKDSLRALLPTLAPAAKARISDSYLCKVNALISPPEGFENRIYSTFYATFAAYFDPHSTYFSYNDKSSFMASISTENYSLGLYVSQNEKDDIIVEEVVPGGPAYKTQKIDKGDQLLKLATNEQEYSVSCASLETISNIVLSDTYRNVLLTLRKNDGTVYSVNLEKKIMKADDHKVYSFVLGDTTKVGYIRIPSFYTAVNGSRIKGVSDDVAKEIARLKKDKVKSLVLDLQYNGGGSMEEAIKLAGMFIDYGPLALISDKQITYNIIRDFDRGMAFKGPVVVLVNGSSASASEFFAGILQDYNRAIIAGSSTLGKASMQTILPLEGSREDFVKVTIDKFYRVTGKSSQYTGISPDIEMPNYFEKLMPRESSMPMALKNDSIQAVVPFKKLPDLNTKKAVAFSNKRIENNEALKTVISVNERIDAIYTEDKPALPITFDRVFADVHSMDAIWKDINAAAEKDQGIMVANTTYSADTIKKDEFLTSVNDQKIKAVKADAYIKEAVAIATDLYNLELTTITLK